MSLASTFRTRVCFPFANKFLSIVYDNSVMKYCFAVFKKAESYRRQAFPLSIS